MICGRGFGQLQGDRGTIAGRSLRFPVLSTVNLVQTNSKFHNLISARFDAVLDLGMVKRFLQSLFVSLSRLRVALALVLSIGLLWLSTSTPVAASANDDSFDGNIFALYAGNGSLVPPKQTIAESIAQGRPSLLVLYLEDSKDCKLFASKVSRLQGFYGRYTSIIPINIDSLPLEGSGEPTDPATYNDQLVPKTVLFDREGNIVLNVTGNVPFETIDDKFREVFNLLPRDESEELILREPLNEINTELSQ